MSTLSNGFLDLAPLNLPARSVRKACGERLNGHCSPPVATDPEPLRRVAWEIGERRAGDSYVPAECHVGLAPVSPGQGFAHWRILQGWVESTAWSRGDAWRDCRLVLRIYDISYIDFNGFNAHSLHDFALPSLCGRMHFKQPRPAATQLAEVGFLLRSGEFIPAARSRATPFPPFGPSPRGGHCGLYVDGRGRMEEVGSVWEQERILNERRRPRLRSGLRIAAFAWSSAAVGHDGAPARFVAELAAGQCAAGCEPHVFLPASASLPSDCVIDGVHYHALDVQAGGSPVEQARAFGQAARERLDEFDPFDLYHIHEWMSALDFPRPDGRAAILSLSSVEATRRNGSATTELSSAIEHAECEAARSADFVLTPDWLQARAAADLGVDARRIRAFPMEGRLPNEWEAPIDYGHVKMEIGVGPLDRLILFVGPLEHAAGVDLLVEALPVLLQRAPQLRLAFVGLGGMAGCLEQRAAQLCVGHAVRLIGHVEGPRLTRLLRAAEALALPSRYRVPFDDAVVDLARRAGRPVVTTHGGPAHLVRHEENGLVTYDNPGSMVWALDRILGNASHAEQMGRNGRRGGDGAAPVWGDVARLYLEMCVGLFPELTETEC
jgi:glycosyltransferase involved in cell wall biosynthesis